MLSGWLRPGSGVGGKWEMGGKRESKRASWFREPNANPPTTIKSETGYTSGPRTELKDFDVEEENVVPGLKDESWLHVK